VRVARSAIVEVPQQPQPATNPSCSYGQCLDGKCSTRGFWEKRNKVKIGYWRGKKKNLKVAGEEKKDSEKTALHFATIYRDYNLVHKLCMDGLDVDAVDEDGKTPLHIACDMGQADCARLLVAKQADVNKYTNAGWGDVLSACGT